MQNIDREEEVAKLKRMNREHPVKDLGDGNDVILPMSEFKI